MLPIHAFALGQALAGAVWHLMVAARGTKKPFPGRIPLFGGSFWYFGDTLEKLIFEHFDIFDVC